MDGGLDQDGSSGDDEEWSTSGCTLKMNTAGFPAGSGTKKRKQASKMTPSLGAYEPEGCSYH